MSAAPQPEVVIPELLQGQWTAVVICTFGANLTFFETRLMNQLAQVPLRIILADDGQLATTLEEAARTEQRHRLANKAYVAAPIRHPRAAHAKLMLLVGPDVGRLIIGSGNLGYDGYASPGELWHVFSYSTNDAQHLNEFAAARRFLDDLASRELIDPPVVELMQTAWGTATWLPASETGPPAVISNLERSLVDQLAELAPAGVRELATHAPFHDEDCAALEKLITTFNPSLVRLLVTNATSANPAAIERVLGQVRSTAIELVEVKDEPATYIHAKWVHFIHHDDSETLLTGSANLSRSALLKSSATGNIELGVFSRGPRGSFDVLYSHLARHRIASPSLLDISYQGRQEEQDEDAPDNPVALWSRLDGNKLVIVFDQVVPGSPTLVLEDHSGRPLGVIDVAIDGATVTIKLQRDSAEHLADGGRIAIRFGQDAGQACYTWPYQLAHLRGRLDKANQREQLPRIGDLPERDAELYELLRELDQTLLIDREAVWRIATPAASADTPSGADEGMIGLADLDWARVRRDPRYGGYFTRGRAAGLPPTDIQVVLSAIGGRLGDLGLDVNQLRDDSEGDLARESVPGMSAESEEADEELEDELSRRRLDVSTRTRLAFDRFVRRYAAALDDAEFINELGPVPAATNAVIFDHLLARLLERGGVTPRWGINAQLSTWRFLWGGDDREGVLAELDPETESVIRELLAAVAAQESTLRGLVASLHYDVDDTAEEGLRDAARHLLTDSDFNLDSAMLASAAGEASMAPRFLRALAEVAEPKTDGELFEFVGAPDDISSAAIEWRSEQVRRGRGSHQTRTLVIRKPIEGLSIPAAHRLIERAAVAAHYAGHDPTYVRVRFQGNGKAVGFWDAQAKSGLVRIDDEIVDLESCDPPWPRWSVRILQLEAELGVQAQSRRA